MAAIPGVPVDHSGTITNGGTSQEAAPSNISRQWLFIQNVSSGDLWIDFGDTPATQNQPSILLVPDAAISWEAGFGFVPSCSINVIGASTGQAYVCKET